MKFFRLFGLVRRTRRPNTCRRLAIEGLERRELLAAAGTAAVQPDGTLLIEGTQAADTVYVSKDLVMFGAGNVCVQFDNAQGLHLFKKFPVGQVKQVRFNGYGGWDKFENKTEIPCVAYGGDGWDELRGGSGDDELFGEAGTDKLYGGQGWDLIDGGADDDFLFGQGGTDYMGGGNGSDLMNGGAETDYMSGGNGNDRIYGGDGEDFLWGEQGDDLLWGDNNLPTDGPFNDFLYGGIGNDALWGNNGNDFLDGGDGNDTLKGGAGNDWLYGGTGADKLFGEAGYDVLFGVDDKAKDQLHGGSEADLLVRSYGKSGWTESEVIQDETKGLDVVFDGDVKLIQPHFWWAGWC